MLKGVAGKIFLKGEAGKIVLKGDLRLFQLI